MRLYIVVRHPYPSACKTGRERGGVRRFARFGFMYMCVSSAERSMKQSPSLNRSK